MTRALAYNHFGVHEGLLIAVHPDFDDRWMAVLDCEFGSSAESLEDVVEVVWIAHCCRPRTGAIHR